MHKLMIHGLVKRPLLLTMKDILRFRRSAHPFHRMPGQWRMNWRAAQMNSLQFSHAWSVARWTGVRLSTLLEEIGVRRRRLGDGRGAEART